jgi:hypothetical protein
MHTIEVHIPSPENAAVERIAARMRQQVCDSAAYVATHPDDWEARYVHSFITDEYDNLRAMM